jgi:hypothetical protein
MMLRIALATSLAIALSMTSAVSAAETKQKLVTASDDRTYDDIKECLVKVGLEEGTNFRQKPGSKPESGRVQLHPSLYDDPIWETELKLQVDACFTGKLD